MKLLTLIFNVRVSKIICAFSDSSEAEEFLHHVFNVKHWNYDKMPTVNPAKEYIPMFDTAKEALEYFGVLVE